MPVTSWYTVFTRPNWERKVVDNLSKKRIECYCPYNKIVNTSGNRKKIDYKPLFTSLVFVRINSLRLGEVKKIDGIINLMYWLDKPVLIRDIEIEMIKRFLSIHSSVQLENTFVNVNDMVKITNGSLQEDNESGINVYAKTVKLLLPTLGFSLIAEINNEEAEVHINIEDQMLFKHSTMQNTLNYGL